MGLCLQKNILQLYGKAWQAYLRHPKKTKLNIFKIILKQDTQPKLTLRNG